MADYEEDEYNPKNALHVLFRLIETMHENMGRDDEGRADDFCLRRKIKNDKIFMPSTLMTEIFKFDYDLNRAMFEIGRASARQVIAINP